MSGIEGDIARLKELAIEAQVRNENMDARMDRCERMLIAIATQIGPDALTQAAYRGAAATLAECLAELRSEAQ